ncbi:MAG: homoserine dehydrogenase [Caldilineaceae bacterium]
MADSSGVAVEPAGFDPTTLRLHKEAGRRARVICPVFVPTSPRARCSSTGRGPRLGFAAGIIARGPGARRPGAGGDAGARPRRLRGAGQQGTAGAGLPRTARPGPSTRPGRPSAPPSAASRPSSTSAAAISLPRTSPSCAASSTAPPTSSRPRWPRGSADALAEASVGRIAEADPTLDVEGWDTANKLVIIANSFLGVRATLDDVTVRGITDVTTAQLQAELAQGNTIKLVAAAVRTGDRYTFRVAPTVVPADTFLGQCDGWEMGVEIHSDLHGRMYHKMWEREPLPTAAAMLRDAVNLFNSAPRPG